MLVDLKSLMWKLSRLQLIFRFVFWRFEILTSIVSFFIIDIMGNIAQLFIFIKFLIFLFFFELLAAPAALGILSIKVD